MIRMRTRSLLVLGGLALCFIVGCEGSPTPIVLSPDEATQTALPSTRAAAPTIPVTLRLGVSGFRGFDPLSAVDAATEQVQALIYETLWVYDTDGILQPLLAAGQPIASDDGFTWTVALREGVTFHDGAALDADVVAASLEAVRLRQPGDAPWPLAVYAFRQKVAGVTGAGMTLTVHLLEPYPALPALLAEQSLAITHGEGVGTGPFRLAEAGVTGGAVTLTANSAYHGGVPRLSGVQVKILDEGAGAPAAIIEAVAGGAIDLGVSEEPLSLDPAAVYQVWEEVTQASWLIFNRRVPPLDQAEVRLGLAQSGRARAFDLLARAGLPDGFDLVVWNAASVPVTGLPFEQLGIIPVSVVPVTEVELSWGLTGSESFRPAGERADLPGSLPGALGVTWTRDWERQWWLALAGWDAGAEPASEADRMGVPLSGAGGSVIYRRGLAGLGVTSGGWPRITAQTVLP